MIVTNVYKSGGIWNATIIIAGGINGDGTVHSIQVNIRNSSVSF